MTTKDYDIDTVFKILGEPLDYSIDTLLKRNGDTKTYSIDVALINVISKAYSTDVSIKKTNTVISCFIDVFIYELFSFSHILERNVAASCKVSTPDLLNEDPTIDTGIWNKKRDILTIVARLTDTEKQTLDGLIGTLFKMTETLYIHTVVFDDYEYVWAGSENFTRPWKLTANFIILGTESV